MINTITVGTLFVPIYENYFYEKGIISDASHGWFIHIHVLRKCARK